MGAAADHDDTSVLGKLGVEQVEEQRVADVADCEGLFEPVDAFLNPAWKLKSGVED